VLSSRVFSFRIYTLYDEPTVSDSGFGVFLQTIPYRYYCIFMLFFMPAVILSGRDSGPMLVSERLMRVYGRTDGGSGRALAVDGGVLVSHNEPAPDTPCRWWNMAFVRTRPVGLTFYHSTTHIMNRFPVNTAHYNAGYLHLLPPRVYWQGSRKS
jgi:hypothetical protein